MLPEAGNDGLYGALVRAFSRCPRRAPPYQHGVTYRSGMVPLTPIGLSHSTTSGFRCQILRCAAVRCVLEVELYGHVGLQL